MIKLRSIYRSSDDELICELHKLAYVDQGSRFESDFYSGFQAHVADTVAEADLGNSPESRVWFAVNEQDAPLGCIAMIDRGKRVQLRWFCVVPEARGQGTGRILMDAALEYARSGDWQEIYLETIDALDASMAMYRKAGFEVARNEPQDLWYGPGREIQMTMAI